MLSYPKRYPVKIKIVGLITSPSFQKVKCYAQMLHDTRPEKFLQPHFITLLEFDWKKFIKELCKETGKMIWLRKTEVTVFWNGHLLGDDQEFYNIIFHRFHTVQFSSRNISYISMGRNERHKYFSRDPDKSYVHFNILYEGMRGTLLFELHSDLLPKTCSKFMKLCLSNPLKEKNISYLGSYMHRLCVNGWIQGGVLPIDIPKFPDESYAVSHNQRGILSLCNDGKNSNESQFFITFQPSTWMDGYYVAIGRIIEGHYVLNELENCAVINESPVSDIIINNCGILPYGRGINVRKQFIKEIAREIKKKWKHITEKLLDKKISGSIISLGGDHYQSLVTRVDVDTNYNHLINSLLSIEKGKITHSFNIKQYLTAILLESVKEITHKYKVHKDVIDVNDTSSEILLQERFEKDLYSIQSPPEILLNVIELCKRTNFFNKVRKLQQQVLKLNYEADLTASIEKISETDITRSITQILKSSQSITDESQGKKSDYASFEFTDEIKEEENEDDFRFDPIPEILEELVTNALAESNLVRDESVQNELKDSIIKLIKLILDDIL